MMFANFDIKHKSNRFLFFCVLVVGMASMTACSEPDDAVQSTEKHVITIAVSKTPLSAPFYIAAAKGFFSEQGININFDDTVGGHRCLAKVIEGKADMGTSSDYAAMVQSFNHDNYAIAATFVSSTNDVKLVASKLQGIEKASDLVSKRIGTVMGGSSHYFLDKFLFYNGLELNDVQIVHIKPDEMPVALLEGKVDALSVWEPYAYLAVEELKDKALLFPSEKQYRETFNLIIAKDYIKNNPDNVKKVIIALIKADEYIRNNPEDAQKILAGKLGLDKDFIDWIWKDYNFRVSLDQLLLATLEQEARWARKNGIIKTKERKNYLDYLHLDTLWGIDSSMVTIAH